MEPIPELLKFTGCLFEKIVSPRYGKENKLI